MHIRDLFVSKVTRDIPPVVYFHEQSPDKLAAEVSEYIITGGWPAGHPNHRRVPSGIHEQYVKLLTNIAAALANGGTDLPNAWISGFYGSGKSSFAKLLGFSLNGTALPDGSSLAEAWLRRDTSPKASELREAWRALRQKIDDPIAVVFDIGSVARDNEHIHATAVRQVQHRLGYCKTEPLVADFELRLERDGEWSRFEKCALATLGKPWAEVKDKALVEEEFSLVMSVLYPERYTDPMSWFTSRGGTHSRSESPEEAVTAIRDMLKFREPRATLFLVIDEVSQYVLANSDRVDRFRAFATAIGSTLRGKAWIFALGQQKLDEDAGDSFLVWAKERFPDKLRVHLATTNIRDVVHKRLLQKKPEAEGQLRTLFEANRHDLKLYGYKGDEIAAEDFVEVYPLLPGQIDLILEITTALRRTQSNRGQGDDQAIRGLLQLLGELFRSQKLADQPVGALITLDQMYEVQHTALATDVQDSMTRVLSECVDDATGLLVRVAKVVALLQQIQEKLPTDAKLVAQCLYDRVDRGNHVAAVTEALEELRRRNLLGYSEKLGYKLQSSSAEEWERNRRDIGVPREEISAIVQAGLTMLLASPDKPKLQGRPFPWAGHFSDGRRLDDVSLVDPRDDAAMHVDFRFLPREERVESAWVKRSDETTLRNRLVWLCGDNEQVDNLARELHRSRTMVKKHKSRRERLSQADKDLLQQEEGRIEDLERPLREAIGAAWMAGKMYFHGRPIDPQDHGPSFAVALNAAATRVLPDLFPHFIATQILPAELMQLVPVHTMGDADLTGLSPKFMSGELGVFELDSGRYVPTCSGVVPRRVQEYIDQEKGVSGAMLLAHFGRPPFGYTANVVKACVAGLLRASRVKLQPESGAEINAVRDAGAYELFEKERGFRAATIFPAGEDDVGPQARARICKFFQDALGHPLDREDHAIADAVVQHFPQLAHKLRGVQSRLNQLPGSPTGPAVFAKLGDALEQCIRSVRQTKPTVMLVKKHLDTLRDGVQVLNLYDAELTADAIRSVVTAADVLEHQAAQLHTLGVEPSNVEVAAARIQAQLEIERPWREIGSIADDLDEIRRCYAAERTTLLQWQEQHAEAARLRIKQSSTFSTLTGEQSHKVLRPLTNAITDTTAEAVAPSLVDLRDPFSTVLARAEDEANEILDRLREREVGPTTLTKVMDLALRNREVETEADIQALIDEIKRRLLEQVRAGVRVRLK